MTKSRKLDPDDFSDEDTPKVPEGLDLRALGPSDSSAAGKEDIRDANDIAPDRIVGPEEAGVSGHDDGDDEDASM